MNKNVIRLLLASTLFYTALSPASEFSQRADVQAFINDLAIRQNFKVEDLQAAFDEARELPKVLELIKPPADPGVRSWKRYRPRFINSARISSGVDFWKKNAKALAAAEARTGVPAEIIMGIIGVETIYGRNVGDFSTLSALSTLAFDYPARASLFRTELEALFLLARDQNRDVRAYRGSYAGAIGLPQFLPSSIRALGLDGDHDGITDLSNSAADAIFSVANYLSAYGWQTGGKIALPATLTSDDQARALLDAGILPTLDAHTLSGAGVQSDWNGQDNARAALVDFVTPGEPTQYWLGFQNFYVITRYNHSSFYAMSVYELGQAIKLAYETRRDLIETPAKAPAGTPPGRNKHAKPKQVAKSHATAHPVRAQLKPRSKTPAHAL
jgi:membrane-bound lytic murein transglycosylase B